MRNVGRENGFLTIICHAHVTGVDPDRLATLETILKLSLELGFEILPCDRAMHRTAHLA